jgi:hypothetical protein
LRASLSHWPDPTREEYVHDLEGRPARTRALREDAIKLREETFIQKRRR